MSKIKAYMEYLYEQETLQTEEYIDLEFHNDMDEMFKECENLEENNGYVS